MSKLLTKSDFENAAADLGVEVAVIKAVAEVESAGDGFFSNGNPKILFEAHVFSRRTNRKFDSTHPNISSKKWDKSLYKGGIKEYDRLNEAIKLNEIAALESASWGKFQIMGFNFKICGWSDVKTFVNDMYKSEGEHLKAFVGFIKTNRLEVFLRNKDWAGFALRYNGSGYAQNKYDVKMAEAYIKYSKEVDKEEKIEVKPEKEPEKEPKKEAKSDKKETFSGGQSEGHGTTTRF